MQCQSFNIKKFKIVKLSAVTTKMETNITSILSVLKLRLRKGSNKSVITMKVNPFKGPLEAKLNFFPEPWTPLLHGKFLRESKCKDGWSLKCSELSLPGDRP